MKTLGIGNISLKIFHLKLILLSVFYDNAPVGMSCGVLFMSTESGGSFLIAIVVLCRLYVIYDCDLPRVYSIIKTKWYIYHNICAVVPCAYIPCDRIMGKWNVTKFPSHMKCKWRKQQPKTGPWPAKVYPENVAHVSWWCHSMKMVMALLAICQGNPLITGGSHPLRARNLDLWWFLLLLLAWTSCWVNN